jgi:hypothetical protein
MVKDFVWRQFILFCYRNGHCYGESGSGGFQKTIRSIYSDDTKHTVVRYRSAGVNDECPSRIAPGDENRKNGIDEAERVIVVGSLERSHREVLVD